MLLRLLSAVFAVFLATEVAIAQQYEPGWLVRNTSDTLRVEIENSHWGEPPTFIRYRSGPDGSSELVRAHQVQAFSVAGRYFRTEVLPVDHAAETRNDLLPRENYTNVHADSLLAEVLVTGPATLWRVVRPGSTHLLLRRENQPVLDLAERRYLHQLAATGTWVVTEGNNYRNQLTLYLADCPAARTVAQTAPFTAAGLVAIAQAYNTSCSLARQPGRTWLEKTALRRHMLEGGVVAGLRYQRVLADIANPNPTDTPTDAALHPFAGLYGELFQPGRKASLYGELSLSTFRCQGTTYLTDGYGGYAATVPVDYRGALATTRLSGRYRWVQPHEQSLLLSVGLELNFVLAGDVTLASAGRSQTFAANSMFATGIVPALGVGWQRQRVTLVADGQLYRSARNAGFTYSGFGLRASLSYRLGRPRS